MNGRHPTPYHAYMYPLPWLPFSIYDIAAYLNLFRFLLLKFLGNFLASIYCTKYNKLVNLPKVHYYNMQ